MSRAIQWLVLAGAAAVFVVGTGLGLSLATSSPEPVEQQEAACTRERIAAGELLTSNLVMVHVYNASRRAGLATRVKINLERRGFLGGVAENNPGAVKARNVTILTDDPNDPRVKLVAVQFRGKVVTAQPDFELEDGVSVLVGSDYEGLKKKAQTRTKVSQPVTVCKPTVELS